MHLSNTRHITLLLIEFIIKKITGKLFCDKVGLN